MNSLFFIFFNFSYHHFPCRLSEHFLIITREFYRSIVAFPIIYATSLSKMTTITILSCDDCDDYSVGWICALPLEMAAASLMLDEIHPVPSTDQNTYYIFLETSRNNVVIACLPSGAYGTISAISRNGGYAAVVELSLHSLWFYTSWYWPSSNADMIFDWGTLYVS